MKPQLLYSEDGKLFIQIEMDGVVVIRPTPTDLKNYSAEDSRTFFQTVVPSMIEELVTLRTNKRRKLRKKNASKRPVNAKRRNSNSDGRTETLADGTTRIRRVERSDN